MAGLKDKLLNRAGSSAGIAQLIAQRGAGDLDHYLRLAAQDMDSYPAYAQEFLGLVGRPAGSVDGSEIFEIADRAMKEMLATEPARHHAFAAGMNIGWTVQTLAAIQAASEALDRDRGDLMAWIANAGSHTKEIGPSNATGIDQATREMSGRFSVLNNPDDLAGAAPHLITAVKGLSGKLLGFYPK